MRMIHECPKLITAVRRVPRKAFRGRVWGFFRLCSAKRHLLLVSVISHYSFENFKN